MKKLYTVRLSRLEWHRALSALYMLMYLSKHPRIPIHAAEVHLKIMQQLRLQKVRLI